MKIVLDARWIFKELSGIGLYTRELIRNLPAVDQENEYSLLFDDEEVMQRERRETGFGDAPNFESRLVNYGVFSLTSQILLPNLLSKLNADLFHSPNYMVPFVPFPRNRSGRTACVITIHDLIPLLFPHYTPRALKTRLFPVFKRVMREAALRADGVIAPSQSTRDDIAEHLYQQEGAASRVHVVYQGVTDAYAPAERSQSEVSTILYVGRFDPYKNVPKLIEAYARLRRKDLNLKLRIVGSDDQRYPAARQTARRLGVEDEIQWDGYIDGPGLIDAYQQADVFVLPSRYEGFGLTVLEAMACGTPVVCGNQSSLPEVVGEAALTVDPDSVEQIESAVSSIVQDPATAERLRKQGLERSAKFTWRQTASRTVQLYNQIGTPAVENPM